MNGASAPSSAPSSGPSPDDVFVVAYEPGQTGAALPTWASARAGLIAFETGRPPGRRRSIEGLPGGFHIEGVLSAGECAAFTALTSRMGYTADAPVSLPHEIRHNTNVNWVADDSVVEPVWERCKAAFHERLPMTDGRVLAAAGLNARLRFYRYGPGDYFKPHTDGAWPGSKVTDGRLTADAYGDRISWFTLLLFLSDGYEGGGTRFYTPAGPQAPGADGGGGHGADGGPGGPGGAGAPHVEISVKTPKGWALAFPHGHHPLHCLHAGEPVTAGVKDIIRTDVLFV